MKRAVKLLALCALVVAAVGGIAVTLHGDNGNGTTVADPATTPSPAYTFHPSAAQQREVARAERRVARQQARAAWRAANARRPVYLQIMGTATNATITYTTTGGGTGQRLVQVPHAWGPSVTAMMRPGDFVDISAQNEGEYGSISCRIMERTAYGVRKVVPVSTSSGPYTIVDCNGEAR